MARMTYVGIIKNDEVDTKTLVVAEDERDVMNQVLEKCKSSLNYTEEDVTIMSFSEVLGGMKE